MSRDGPSTGLVMGWPGMRDPDEGVDAAGFVVTGVGFDRVPSAVRTR